MIDTSPQYLAAALWRYGEPDVAMWVETCSDDEFLRIASVSHWLVLHGPRGPRGGPMGVDKALATAAVYVHEGRPRELARRNRMRVDPAQWAHVPTQRLGWDPRLDYPSGHFRHYGVAEDARTYWEHQPASPRHDEGETDA